MGLARALVLLATFAIGCVPRTDLDPGDARAIVLSDRRVDALVRIAQSPDSLVFPRVELDGTSTLHALLYREDLAPLIFPVGEPIEPGPEPFPRPDRVLRLDARDEPQWLEVDVNPSELAEGRTARHLEACVRGGMCLFAHAGAAACRPCAPLDIEAPLLPELRRRAPEDSNCAGGWMRSDNAHVVECRPPAWAGVPCGGLSIRSADGTSCEPLQACSSDSFPSGDPSSVYVGSSTTPGDGSLGRPFQTLQQALDVAPSGGTILVGEGSFVAEVSVLRDVIIRGLCPEKTVLTIEQSDRRLEVWASVLLEGLSVRADGQALVASHAALTLRGVAVEGGGALTFEVRASTLNAANLRVDGRGDLALAAIGSTVTVARTSITGSSHHGFYVNGGSAVVQQLEVAGPTIGLHAEDAVALEVDGLRTWAATVSVTLRRVGSAALRDLHLLGSGTGVDSDDVGLLRAERIWIESPTFRAFSLNRTRVGEWDHLFVDHGTAGRAEGGVLTDSQDLSISRALFVGESSLPSLLAQGSTVSIADLSIRSQGGAATPAVQLVDGVVELERVQISGPYSAGIGLGSGHVRATDILIDVRGRGSESSGLASINGRSVLVRTEILTDDSALATIGGSVIVRDARWSGAKGLNVLEAGDFSLERAQITANEQPLFVRGLVRLTDVDVQGGEQGMVLSDAGATLTRFRARGFIKSAIGLVSRADVTGTDLDIEENASDGRCVALDAAAEGSMSLSRFRVASGCDEAIRTRGSLTLSLRHGAIGPHRIALSRGSDILWSRDLLELSLDAASAIQAGP